jgi:hypothetical protein
MAEVCVNRFSLTELSGNRVRIGASYTVKPTAMELRLGSPVQVWFRLKSYNHKDKAAIIIENAGFRPFTDRDEDASVWMSAGVFTGYVSAYFTRTIPRENLPGEAQSGSWSLVAACRSDLITDMDYSSEVVAGLI